MTFEHTRQITPSVEGERTPRDTFPSQAETSQTMSATSNGNGVAPAEVNGTQDRQMEDVRSNGRSGSEEGELG